VAAASAGSASAPSASAPSAVPSDRASLYTLPFIAICLETLFGFAQNFTLQPMLPLIVLAIGGSGAIVGIIFLVFSIPSVVLRPFIGRLSDRLGARPVLLLGTGGIALAGPLYAIPSVAVLVLLRIVHGTAWAALNTGGPSVMASLAPPARRGEAASAFDMMPGLAVLIMPTVSLLLYARFGLAGPILLASLLGAASLAVVVWLIPDGVGARSGTASSGGALLEPSAVLPMVYQLLMNSVLSLFVVYPPLFAQHAGLPVSDLVLYYPAYGIAFVVARIGAGRIVDRVPRSRVMIVGAALAATALVLAATASTIAILTVAGVIYAIANGATAPATTALVLDRAPAGRVGAAMATYTLGFQFGSGLGAALWGFLIDANGFEAPFVIGAGLQIFLLVLVLARRSTLRPANAG
jgi:MFS family permease